MVKWGDYLNITLNKYGLYFIVTVTGNHHLQGILIYFVDIIYKRLNLI